VIEAELRELDEAREFVCQRPGCWLIHLKSAAASACDAA